MGDRYFITVICPQCGFQEDGVYYAPTCGFTGWQCPHCKRGLDLGGYTGISYEDCSNRDVIEEMCKEATK